MPEVINWKARPIFITSTFRDMHAERDYLRTHVFPVLEERLRERFHHLEVIDLRWGVESSAEEDLAAREILVLKVCLNEIERSRPFLIGLLGDRYGWVPPIERMQTAAGEAGFDRDLTGKSVTELEILYGVLDSEEQKKRSWFYLRDLTGYDKISPEKAAEYSDEYGMDAGAKDRKAHLDALKQRLENEVPDRVRHYSGQWNHNGQCVIDLKQWGQQVLEDLWGDLERETAEYLHQAPQTWQEQEIAALEEFIEGRTRGFFGRKSITRNLLDLALSPASENADWAACVTGASGTGKSSLFGHLYRQLQANDDIFVLAHAAGISPKSNAVDSMLRSWVYALAKELGQTDPLNDTNSMEDVDNAFSRLLGQAAFKKRIVILVDALNQFELTTRARYLTWLPTLWPENVRFIATAIPCEASESLINKRGARKIPIPLLAEQEAEEIAHTLCQRYHRRLNQDVLRVLLDKRTVDNQPAAGNALWLELAIEELNLLDADAFTRGERQFADVSDPEKRLQALLIDTAKRMPPDVSDLYNWIIDRAEKLFGKAWTQAFVNLIAVSRSGWRESDLCELMPKLSGEPWDDLRFASLRRAFRSHVIQRGKDGQWDFSHNQMPSTVNQLFIEKDEQLRHLHETICSHLKMLPKDDPMLIYTFYHIINARNVSRGAKYFSNDLPMEEEAHACGALVGFIVNTDELEHSPAVDFVLGILQELSAHEDLTLAACRRLLQWVIPRVQEQAGQRSQFELLIPVGDRLLRRNDLGDEAVFPEVSMYFSEITKTAINYGYFSMAVENLQAFEQLVLHLIAERPMDLRLQTELPDIYLRFGRIRREQEDFDKAIQEYKRAETACISILNIRPDDGVSLALASAYGAVGEVLRDAGDPNGAMKELLKSKTILVELNTRCQDANTVRYLCWTHSYLAEVLYQLGDIDSASAEVREQKIQLERWTELEPHESNQNKALAAYHWNEALIADHRNDTENALTHYIDAHLAITKWAAENRGNPLAPRLSAKSYNGLADAFFRFGRIPQAKENYHRCLDIYKALQRQGMKLNNSELHIVSAVEEKLNNPSMRSTSISVPSARPSRENKPEQEHIIGSPIVEKTSHSMESSALLNTARNLLSEQKPEEALAVLKTFQHLCPEVDNAKAVCLMRLGNADQARDILVRHTFDTNSFVFKPDTPIELKTNFVTTLILRGEVEGAQNYLDQIKEIDHPSVRKLVSALDKWKKSLTFLEKVKFNLTGNIPNKPITLDFLPGELMKR
ncbi:DUF4062 domain-containing protein [Planctomycetota bacterium]